MRILANFFLVLCLLGAGGTATRAQEPGPAAQFKGTWRGEATFLLPEGVTKQLHVFEFGEAKDRFVTGEHGWNIPSKNLKSHDGEEWTYVASEPFLGVVDTDGTVWLVEKDDKTIFKLRLVEPDTIDFIAFEGDTHPVVGHGTLKRE